MLVISGDGPRLAAAAQGRVDRIARRLRNSGDARTIAQLRADVATDLLLRGWIPTDPTFIALGQPPTAVVQLIVSLPTLLSLDSSVGQIPSWGHVDGHRARELALQAGSIWKRIVTDPLTGRAIEASATTYKVPAAMAEQINARDRTCRAPGCEIPADHCDHDHTKEWKPDGAGGPTAETNLADLHRGHHNLKTGGFWDSDQSPDGTLTWTTATGRTFTTYPYIYDHPDNTPIKTSTLEAHLGRRLAPAINPDIPLPGHFSIFDELDWGQALAPATPPPQQHTWANAAASQKQRLTTATTTPRAPTTTRHHPSDDCVLTTRSDACRLTLGPAELEVIDGTPGLEPLLFEAGHDPALESWREAGATSGGVHRLVDMRIGQRVARGEHVAHLDGVVRPIGRKPQRPSEGQPGRRELGESPIDQTALMVTVLVPRV